MKRQNKTGWGVEERNREGNKGNGQKMRGGRQEEQQHDVQTSLSQKGNEKTEGVLKRTSRIKKRNDLFKKYKQVVQCHVPSLSLVFFINFKFMFQFHLMFMVYGLKEYHLPYTNNKQTILYIFFH